MWSLIQSCHAVFDQYLFRLSITITCYFPPIQWHSISFFIAIPFFFYWCYQNQNLCLLSKISSMTLIASDHKFFYTSQLTIKTSLIPYYFWKFWGKIYLYLILHSNAKVSSYLIIIHHIYLNFLPSKIAFSCCLRILQLSSLTSLLCTCWFIYKLCFYMRMELASSVLLSRSSEDSIGQWLAQSAVLNPFF